MKTVVEQEKWCEELRNKEKEGKTVLVEEVDGKQTPWVRNGSLTKEDKR